ncbi:MAG: PTS sugar transporter subunit IIA [Phycisphaerae bacterium]
MPYRTMSLEEFAKHVGVDEREVRRLADRGKLPGHKLAGQWRFHRARVTEWLQQEMHALDESRLIAIERSMSTGGDRSVSDRNCVVTDLIGLDGIEIALPARTKASVLRELVKLAERTGLLYDAQGLLEAVEQREALCSTALPSGIAIPHPRQPMPYVSAEPLICVARLARGVGFGSPGGDLTRLFFLICCHTDRYHLHVLARLMRILDPPTIDRLLHASASTELLEVLIEKEREVIARMS